MKLHVVVQGKALDVNGLSAEYLAHAGLALREPLTTLFNAILDSATVPIAFKCGLLLPLLKKSNKPKNSPVNY